MARNYFHVVFSNYVLSQCPPDMPTEAGIFSSWKGDQHANNGSEGQAEEEPGCQGVHYETNESRAASYEVEGILHLREEDWEEVLDQKTQVLLFAHIHEPIRRVCVYVGGRVGGDQEQELHLVCLRSKYVYRETIEALTTDIKRAHCNDKSNFPPCLLCGSFSGRRLLTQPLAVCNVAIPNLLRFLNLIAPMMLGLNL